MPKWSKMSCKQLQLFGQDRFTSNPINILLTSLIQWLDFKVSLMVISFTHV